MTTRELLIVLCQEDISATVMLRVGGQLVEIDGVSATQGWQEGVVVLEVDKELEFKEVKKGPQP